MKHQQNKNSKSILISIFFVILVLSLYAISSRFIKKSGDGAIKVVSPLTDLNIEYLIKKKTNPENTNTLQNAVQNALKGSKGTYGIVIQNLKTGETYYANEHTVFDTGSLYKLWVMATVYNQIQNGQLQEEQVLSQDVATLNEKFYISSESAERIEGIVTLSVKDALNLMITISDNYAALLLTEKIRLSSVAKFLKNNGLIESTVGTTGDSPTATPSDIALFLSKLYNGAIASSQYTAEMMRTLRNQQLNNGLPKYLQTTSHIAHKTGEIGKFKHDAGIVFSDNGDYIIVIMSESGAPLVAQERIALVSKEVFDYFEKK